MKVLGRNRLNHLFGINDQTDIWVRNWLSELSYANWKVHKDVTNQYPRVKYIPSNIFLFPIADQSRYIEVAMTFHQSVALIVSLRDTTDYANGH